MATYTVVPINAITEVNVEGDLDLESCKRLVRSVAREADAIGKNLLVDMRGVDGHFTFADVYRVVQTLTDHRDVFRGRIALLDHYDSEFEKTQFFEASATVRGINARTFVDEAKAVAWLEETSEDP